MKTSLILLGILLFKKFKTSLTTPLLYTEITDCGDGKIGSFVASVTPNPFVWEDSSDSRFWVGIKLSLTEEAKIFASNISVRDFARDLQYYTVFDESTWALIPDFLRTHLVEYNNTCACGTVVAPEMCPTLLQAASLSLTNITAFSSFQWGLNNQKFMLDMIDFILKITHEIDIKLQAVITIYGRMLACGRIAIKVEHYDDKNGTASDYRSRNIQHAFDTPKIISIYDQNKILSCPDNSVEINNSSCECSHPFSGPLCSFHCWYDEIIPSLCPTGPGEGTFACAFRDRDYIQYCIQGKGVQYLDGSITVDLVSLSHINIKWKVAHFLVSYKYEITLQDNTGSVMGSIFYDALNLQGLEGSHSIGTLCLNNVAYGVECRDSAYENSYCYDCPDLSLIPFHGYTIVLNLGTGSTRTSFTEYVTTTVDFTTPEVNVVAPKINSAALDEDQNVISVDWILTDKWCPGYIRRYELIVSCNSDQATSSGNLHFDCRSGNQGPKLNGTVPEKCKREDIYLKLRIATANSTSDASEQFLLKNAALSTLAIIAYVLGAFLIAVAIASLIFYYYYKRHVKSFQNAHQAVRKLLHIQRKSGVGQSFRVRSAPNLPIPDVPESCNSPGGTTAYQTIAVTSEVGTPHSLQAHEIPNETVPTTPRDSLGYTLAKFL